MENQKKKSAIQFHVAILTSLLINLICLTVIISAVVLVVSIAASTIVARDLEKSYFEKTGEVIEERLDSFFHPVANTLRQTQKWAKSGLMVPEEIDRFRALMLPILQGYPQITSLCTGNEKGFSNRIGAENDGFLSRIVGHSAESGSAKFAFLSASGEILREWEDADDFDARTRDWYLGAKNYADKAATVASCPIFWNDPFILHTSKQPGIAASLPLESANGSMFILTFNLMLEKLSDFTSSLQPSPQGKTFILTHNGDLIGVPGIAGIQTAEERHEFFKVIGARLPKVEDLKSPVLTAAFSSWNKQASTVRSSGNDGNWRIDFRPYNLGENARLWVGMAVPEEDFLGEVYRQRARILAMGVFAIILAIIMGFFLARMYSRPLVYLAESSEAITQLDLTQKDPVESHILEVFRLSETQQRMIAALDSFSRYIPTDVVRELLKRGEAARLGGRATEITVSFCDIRGFTSISETMDPQTLSSHLSVYFENLMQILMDNHGTIDKMIGDAIMTLWGAPKEDSEQCLNAVYACLRCQKFLTAFNSEVEKKGLPRLDTGFGISTGVAMVGNIGAPYRMNYTAIGDIVNLSSRLEGLNKLYGTGILATEAVKNRTGGRFEWRLIDLVAVKGKTIPEKIFEPLGERDKVSADDLDFARSYETAFAAFLNRNFGEVPALLQAALQLRPEDHSVKNLLAKAKHYEENPPPPDWQGIRNLREK